MTNHERCEQGWNCLREGRMDEALAAFVEVLKRDANYATALHGLGYLEQAQGRMRSAEELLARAIKADPKRATAHMHLGGVMQATGRLDAAIASLRRAAAIDPASASITLALAMVLSEKGAIEDALQACARAISLDPASAKALSVQSHVLCLAGDAEQAAAAARGAVALDPASPLPHMNLGIALDRLGRSSDAEMEIRHAIALGGDSPENHLHLANTLLRRGDLAAGWVEYEWRFAARPDAAPASILATPAWDGSKLHGKTLLVQQEQGLGDAIQMARFASGLLDRAAQVIFRCDASLVALLRTLDERIEIASNDTPPPAHDVHVPIMSLPRLLNVTLERIPAAVPYLSADNAEVRQWSALLPARVGTLRVGLVWAGNPKHVNDRNRSMRAAELAPLAALNGRVTWISLQRDHAASDLPVPAIDVSAQLRDFSDTAAAMSALDLIISVDTAPAHLAGALGRPVWTLLPAVAEWRWLRDRSDSPWYPTMRLFRQPRIGDWASVLREVVAALHSLRGAPPAG